MCITRTAFPMVFQKEVFIFLIQINKHAFNIVDYARKQRGNYFRCHEQTRTSYKKMKSKVDECIMLLFNIIMFFRVRGEKGPCER